MGINNLASNFRIFEILVFVNDIDYSEAVCFTTRTDKRKKKNRKTTKQNKSNQSLVSKKMAHCGSKEALTCINVEEKLM